MLTEFYLDLVGSKTELLSQYIEIHLLSKTLYY